MLAILTTHPIQYQVPLWQALARESNIPFEVWYLSDHGTRESHDREFGKAFQWDLDMLKGYPYRFLETTPAAPDITRFLGVRINGIRQLLREHRVTNLWINGWQVAAYWQATIAAHRLGIPVWLRAESNDLRRSHWSRRLPRQLLLRLLFARVSAFLTIGSANRRFYQRFGIEEERLIPAPYCVDNDRFAEAAAALANERDALRAAWNIPDTATCFLFAGKFIPKKRPADLIEAVDRLLSCEAFGVRAEEIHLLLVGDGELRPQLEKATYELETKHGRSLITFAGFLNQKEIPRAYAAADCLVLPSDAGETWGLVVNESLASGRPAIVSDLCGCAEDLARPLGSPFVFPCGHIEDLTSSLAAFCNKGTNLQTSLARVSEAHHPARTVQAVHSMMS